MSTNGTPTRIAVVADEPIVRELLQAIFLSRGFQVSPCGPCVQPEVASECVLECLSNDVTPDLIVLEVLVPRSCSGIEAAHKALRLWPQVKILLISASLRQHLGQDAVELLCKLPSESYIFLAKPFTAPQVNTAVDALLLGVTKEVRPSLADLNVSLAATSGVYWGSLTDSEKAESLFNLRGGNTHAVRRR
jgi:CheY-like chemotaxis protein